MEPRVPGYKGYLPGRQHIYGRTYGMASSALGAEHMRNSEDKNAFLGAALRCAAHTHTRGKRVVHPTRREAEADWPAAITCVAITPPRT